ncbi:hypothetical protein CEXT_781651, partial [Caerostris extrusa]
MNVVHTLFPHKTEVELKVKILIEKLQSFSMNESPSIETPHKDGFLGSQDD